MNKVSSAVLCAISAVSLIAPTRVAAQSTASGNLCTPETAFLFFNGVLTSEPQAKRIRERLAIIHGPANSKGEAIRYETFYNQSNELEDFVETFEQRLQEQDGILANRFELFFKSLSSAGNWWSRITGAVSSLAQLYDALQDAGQALRLRALTALLANPPTTINYAEHRTRLDNFAVEGVTVLMVAHSQGNLFANVAYDYAISKLPPTAVKTVHIAPASPTVRGPHVLADLDLVINGLRVAGSVQDVTDFIPGYALRPAGANGEKDFSGHGMHEIYINQKLLISTKVKNLINDGISSLVTPAAQGKQGFFSATVTWNGSGDVDTHITEPNGRHVWYQNKQGSSGYLDVDNTVANGPEHYYATCSSSALQTGNYSFSLANYSGASGRTAIIQLASYAEGVIASKPFVMGAVSRDTPTTPPIMVAVSKDSAGKFTAKILPN